MSITGDLQCIRYFEGTIMLFDLIIMRQWNINLLKWPILKLRYMYVPQCRHTLFQSNTTQCMNAVMLTWLYCDYFESGLWESWHGIWFTALEQFDCIKVTPDFNLVFKFSKLRRTPNVTASSKTTYTLIMQRFFPFSLSISLSHSLHTHTHTPSHAYRHDALFILWYQSHHRRYYHCRTMHWHVPCVLSTVCHGKQSFV